MSNIYPLFPNRPRVGDQVRLVDFEKVNAVVFKRVGNRFCLMTAEGDRITCGPQDIVNITPAEGSE